MDVLDAIKERRSVRDYTNTYVSERDVKLLIDAARCAPSAGNIQPWEFVIVRSVELKQKLSDGAFHQKFVQNAPVIIVVCADINRSRNIYGIRGETFYSVQDTAAATQNILLTAQKLGLATCWVGAFNENEIAKVVNAPKNVRPVAIISVGYPASTPMVKKKRPFNEIVHNETF